MYQNRHFACIVREAIARVGIYCAACSGTGRVRTERCMVMACPACRMGQR